MKSTTEDDGPTPGGFANGVWKQLPPTPWTTCSTPFTRRVWLKACSRMTDHGVIGLLPCLGYDP
jgi:hypothetical protein